MLKQSLSQKQLQRLSPQQIQLMKLLQVPTASLEEWIQKEMEENPILEAGAEEEDEVPTNETSDGEEEVINETETQEAEFEEYVQEYVDDDPYSYKLRVNNSSSDDEEKTIPIAVQHSFHDFLTDQLQLLEIKDEQTLLIMRQLVGSIDSDGYLRRDLTAILDDLMFTQNVFVELSDLERVLEQLQAKLDPSGVGARNLRESLMIQLHRKVEQENNEQDFEQLYALNTAYQILEYHFEAFSKKHFERLKSTLNINDEQLKGAMDEVLKLNPKPASGYADNRSSTTQYVMPDFFLINRDGELELSLNNNNAPELRVSPHYQNVLRSYVGKKKQKKSKQQRETVNFIKEKIDKAKWFIDAIRQRQQTMYKTMYAILEYQYNFFLTGDEMQLRPMVLKDIAERTELDISTISRVVNSKYVQTEFGTKLLKDFFSEGIQNQEGDEISTIEIKNVLNTIITEENKRKPLSDEKLKDILKGKGYNIARRTVAKYREQLNIPVARLRKEL